MGLVTLASHITLQRRFRRFCSETLSIVSRFWDPQVAANLARKEPVYFRMARDCRAAVIGGVAPPRVVAAFPHERAAMRREVAYELAALHTFSAASSQS